MRRRDFLATLTAVSTASLAGCSETGEAPDADFDTPDFQLPSLGPDESESNPELTDVTHTEIWRPRKPNVLAIFISYGGVDHSKEYSARARVGSGDSANEGTVEMDTIIDRWYPGKTGMAVSMPDEDDYSFSVPITVSLYEEGEEVDVNEDSVML